MPDSIEAYLLNEPTELLYLETIYQHQLQIFNQKHFFF